MDANYLQQLQQLGLGNQLMQGPKPLVEFKAGRMNYDGRMVTPDRRRGLIRVVKDAHGMTTFQFLDADSQNPIDSFFVFPDEAKFEKVYQTKDRVYLLEMRETKQRFFYWMQEDDKEKDEEWSKKVHNAINNITEQSAQNGSATAGGPATTSTGAGPAGGSGPTGQRTQPQQPPAAAQQFTMPQVPFSGLGQNDGAGMDPQLMQQLQQMFSAQQQQELAPGLATTITHEAMETLITKLSEEEKQTMIDNLPEGQQKEEYLRDCLLSPMFRQTMDALTSAIRSDNIEMILAMCELNSELLSTSPDGMVVLIKAFIEKYSKE